MTTEVKKDNWREFRNPNGTFKAGGKRLPLPEYIKKKIGIAQIGEKNHRWGKITSLEHRNKISSALKGISRSPCSLEHRKKISETKKGSIPWNKGKLLSNEHKKNLSISHKGQISWCKGKKRLDITGNKHPMWGKKNLACAGKRCHFWKGGITTLHRTIRNDIRMEIWKIEVFKKDNYTCQGCGQIGGKLQVHHIKEFSLIIKENNIKTLDEAKSCKELWDVNNGQILCKKCHKNKTIIFMKSNWINQYNDIKKTI